MPPSSEPSPAANNDAPSSSAVEGIGHARRQQLKKYAWQSRIGAYTFPKHLSYSALDGAWQGALSVNLLAYIIINEFALSKDDASLYSTLLHWIPSALMLTAPIWDRPFGRSPKYWVFSGIVCRLLAGMMFALVGAPWHFVLIVAVIGVLSSGTSPLQNAIYATNYAPRERERAHGYAKMAHILAVVGANYGLSELLEWDGQSFRWAIPIAGLIGMLGMLAIASVKVRPSQKQIGYESVRMPRAPRPWEVERATQSAKDEAQVRGRIWTNMLTPMSPARMGFDGIITPYRRSIRLLQRNSNFAIFELGFMLYGCGFMMLQPTFPPFAKEILDLDYQEFSLMTSVVFFGVPFIMHGLLRGVLSGVSPAKGSFIAFSMVLCFPLLLMLVLWTKSFELGLVAFAWFGAAMVFVDYAWNFGPVKFANGRDAMPFVSAHAMMVGLRALIAFPAAYGLSRLTEGNYWWSFSVPAALLTLAVASTLWLGVRMKRTPEQV